MSHPSQLAVSDAVAIEIGGMAIALHTQDFGFRQLLEDRYAGFIAGGSHPQFDFDIDLFNPRTSSSLRKQSTLTMACK